MGKDKSNYYFDNEYIESLCREYVLGGAVDIELRDEIMSHANELIENIIRVNNFTNIMNSSGPTTFGELKHIAWKAIESSLYKFNMTNEYRLLDGRNIRGQPINEDNIYVLIEDKNGVRYKIKKKDIKKIQKYHTKLFGFWSQISKTAILAYIKKDKRDNRNKPHYTDYLINRHKIIRNYPVEVDTFIKDAKSIFVDPTSHKILDGLLEIYKSHNEFPKSFIKEIYRITGISVKTIKQFFKMLQANKTLFRQFLDNIELNKVDYRDSFNED